MNRKSKKYQITEAVYHALTPEQRSSLNTEDIEKLMFRWFATGRASSGLRLTEEGQEIFTVADIEYYDYALVLDKDKMPEIKRSEFALTLSKKLRCPFYIGLKNRQASSAYIRIYDSKVAMMINLYGSFYDYLDSIKNYA